VDPVLKQPDLPTCPAKGKRSKNCPPPNANPNPSLRGRARAEGLLSGAVPLGGLAAGAPLGGGPLQPLPLPLLPLQEHLHLPPELL